MTIPVIDLRSASGDVAREIDRACTDMGFFMIAGHDVDPTVTDAAWRALVAFFELPEAGKATACHPDDPFHPYGWFPPGRERLAASMGVETPPDLKESFNLAPPVRHGVHERFSPAARIWPDAPRDLEPALTAYYIAMEQLADRLLAHFERALGLPAGHFMAQSRRHLSALRGLHYFPAPASTSAGQLRAGAHTDYGTFTVLLPGDGTGGLEVVRRDGVWVPVQPVPGAFVVNIGDMMARWTNDRWRSTLHRVALPHGPGAGHEHRHAIAFFHQPDWDALVSPVTTCVDEANPARYEPVRAGPWLEAKFAAASTR